jgi:5-methylcytosine-specific restriction endonuclease McrA
MCVSCYKKALYKANADFRDHCIAKANQRYASKREDVLAQVKKYKAEHPEVSKREYQKHRDKYIQRAGAWKKTSAGKVAQKNDNARRRTGGHVSNRQAAILENVTRYGDYRCECCGILTGPKYHMDHIVPVSLGGSNGRENLQLLCPKCNMEKGRQAITYKSIAGVMGV